MAAIHGTIYKLASPLTDKIYIGHTTKDISTRLEKHHINYKSYKNGRYHWISAFDIIEIDPNCDIVIIETLNCKHLGRLKERERFHIEQNLDKCVNINIPGRLKCEYHDAQKAHYLKYRDTLLATKSQVIPCECGIQCTRGHMNRHKQTNRHRKALTAI